MKKNIITLTIIIIVFIYVAYKMKKEPFYNISNNDAYPHMLSHDDQKYNIISSICKLPSK